VKNFFVYFVMLCFFVLCWFSCAQVGSVTGGPKDFLPPKITKYSPEYKSLNVKPKKILIRFDEFIDLKNVEQKLLISPPLQEMPECKAKYKNLIIHLPDSLRDSTTYTLDFGDAIVDLNESNPILNFRYVFSTYSQIDSFGVSGKLIDAFTGKPRKDIFVMLFRNLSDSAPYKEIPYYSTRTDTSGNFNINFIKKGKFRLFALHDMNANLKFDLPNEEIAFADSIISPFIEVKTSSDSLKKGTILHDSEKPEMTDTLKNDTVIVQTNYFAKPNDLTIFLFTENKNKQFNNGINREKRGKCILGFSKPLIFDSIAFKLLNFETQKNWNILEKNFSKDTVFLWLTDTILQNKDSLKFLVTFLRQDSVENIFAVTDTLEAVYFSTNKATKLKFKNNSSVDFFANLFLNFENPVARFDTSKMKLYEISDTNLLEIPKQLITEAKRQTETQFKIAFKRPTKDLKIEVFDNEKKSQIVDIQPNANRDTFIFTLKEKNFINEDTLNFRFFYDHKTFYSRVEKLFGEMKIPQKPQLNDTISQKKDTVLQKYSLEIPVSFRIFQDSAQLRKFHLAAKWKEGKTYKLYLDSLAFLDIFGQQNDSCTVKFAVQRKDAYGNLEIKLSNIAKMTEHFFPPKDTLPSQNFISQGQIILQLLNEKNVVLKEFLLQNDKTLKIENLTPAKYQLRAIFDKNKNAKWETGNFLKHLQPERILYYSKEILIKANWDMKIEWNFSKN